MCLDTKSIKEPPVPDFYKRRVPGDIAVPIQFPERGEWMNRGESLDLGPFNQGPCSGYLYKTSENRLYVSFRIMMCGDVKADMPLHFPDGGQSILYIHWEEAGVRLRQDDREPIDVSWSRQQ